MSFTKIGFALASLVASSVAFAAGPDVTALTAAVEFDTVKTAIMSVAGSVIGVYLVIKAGSFIIARVKGA